MAYVLTIRRRKGFGGFVINGQGTEAGTLNLVLLPISKV